MNSKKLNEKGFSDWLLLKTLAQSSLPSDQGIVLVIADKELDGKPESDILYIGRTKKPVKRIMGGYLAGYGGNNAKKINQMLFDEGYLEKTTISWVLTAKPRIMQEELLAKFKEEHGKFPDWNAKKKVSVKAKKKTKGSPKRKEVVAPKLKIASSVRKNVQKNILKSKIAPKKATAKVEAVAKAEMPMKEETNAQEAEKSKPSNDQMSS